MTVFNYELVSSSHRKSYDPAKIKKTRLEPIESIKRVNIELSTFLDDRNACLEIDDLKCSLRITTTQSEAEVDAAVDRCASGLDLEYTKK